MNANIIDDSQWGFVLDGGSKNLMAEADMIKDDENASRPVPAMWIEFKGGWVPGGGVARFDGIGVEIRS
jgi:hypothetical protein